MQPGKTVSDRSRRFPLIANSLVRVFVLGTIVASAAVSGLVPVCAADEAPGRHHPLSARRWSAEDILALPDGPERVDRELHRQGEYSRRWNLIHDLVGGQHVSSKSRELLRKRGLGPALFDKGAGLPSGVAGADVQEDTLRVLIIRMSFETNRDPHLTTIDPSGDFMLDPLTDPLPLEVDPPPHNKAYFESHLQGLSEFYKFMSGGRLNIEGRVLPEGDNDSYKLSDVADYGPGADDFWTLEGLERLVQDMMREADQGTQADGSANLAEYDDNNPFTYIIFVHSGSDWQSDINGDSPNDIPTFFVTLGEPVDLIGSSENGPGQLSECSIIPETTNQDGYPGSIAAAFYHEFGHALGLPDVYSTYSGLPSVGIWDLMDSGTNLPVTMGTITAENDTFVISATGVLPPSISAWNKWFLGWLEMGELDGREGDYQLPPVGVPREDYWKYPELVPLEEEPQAYRAGLSPREWFLLENRWVPEPRPPRSEPLPYNDIRFERDEATGVILYLAGQRQGIWENTGYYDYFMPSGGLLVWHVNGDRILEGLPDNTININNDGLKLVEADGIQDIGVLEAYVMGWYGSYLDPFGSFDPDGIRTGFDTLHVEGFPSSRAYDRSWTGLSLSEIGPRTKYTASVMKFKASQGPVGKGFPYELPPVDSTEAPLPEGQTSVPRALEPGSLTPVTLSEGDQQVLVFADGPPADWTGGDFPATLFHRWADGQRRWVSLPGKPEGAFQSLGAPLSGSPFVMDRVDADGVDLVWGTKAGRVGSTHLPEYNMPAESWVAAFGDSLGGAPVPLTWQGETGRILVPVHPDQLVLLDRDGIQIGESLTLDYPIESGVLWSRLATPIPGAGDSDLIPVYSSFGWWLVSQDADGLVGNPTFYSFGIPWMSLRLAQPFRSAVVESGDDHQVHLYEGGNELGAWRVASVTDVTELGPVLGVDKPLVCEPAVADVDGDGGDDLVLLTADRVHALRPDGVSLRGFPVRFYDLFPLPDTTSVDGPVVVADGTGDGVNEIYFNTDGGHLIGLDATGRLLSRTPMRWGDRETAGLAVGGPDEARVLWLASPGGYTGPPFERQFVNGRVTAYGLANAAVSDARTSEWRGPAGGSARRGSAGEAKNLGPAAPAAAESDQVIFYPNPVGGEDVTIRFFSAGESPAKVGVYNLEGEEVARAEFSVTAGTVNEYVLPLPGLASGLYLARLEYDGTGGMTIKTLTLAVEK